MMSLSFIVITLTVHGFVSGQVGFVPFMYKTCSDPWMQNNGMTWYLRGNDKVWSSCGFPNPRHDSVWCGRDPTVGQKKKFTVCDPDRVLPPAEVSKVDSSSWQFSEQTKYQCDSVQHLPLNFTLMFVLVRHMRIPNLMDTALCLNDCLELQPTLDTRLRAATDREKEEAIRHFTYGLASVWDKELCQSSITYVIWTTEKMVFSLVGTNVLDNVPQSDVQMIEEQARHYVEKGAFKQALLYVADEYYDHLQENTPALILLGIFVFIIFLTGLFLLFILYGSDPLNYWDEFGGLTPLRYFLNIISGVYLIEYILASILYLQYRLKWWHTIVLLVAVLLSCLTFLSYDTSD